jgi:hypothetical protein
MKKELMRLRSIEQHLRDIREQLHISDRGEIVFRSILGGSLEKEVIVESDGFGGATLLVVQGNYPVDYETSSEKLFSTEHEACKAAEQLMG